MYDSNLSQVQIVSHIMWGCLNQSTILEIDNSILNICVSCF